MALKVFFGNLVESYAKQNGLTLAQVAKRAELGPSYLSKWKRGKWGMVPEDVLLRVIFATTKDPEERANLAIAYLTDMTPAPFRPLIDIAVRNAGPKKPETVIGANPDMRRKLEGVARAYDKDDDFRQMTNTLFGWASRINEQ